MKKFETPAAVKIKMKALGELIRAARRARGFTQAQLAERTGTSRPTINRIESGTPNVIWGTVMTVCWILDIPTDPEVMDVEKRAGLLAANSSVQRIRSKQGIDDDF
ncbi:MAG: helix-turn-helix transcriptional regulator [Gammaproteobacteria bacterium]